MTLEQFKETDFYKQNTFLPDIDSTICNLDEWEFFAKNFDNYNSNIKEKKIQNGIPHIIHQIWIGSPLPERYIPWTSSWKKMNPDFEYHLWNDEKILEILDDRTKDIYLNTKNFGAKSDIARYAILKKFGGIYADTDFECLKSFKDLCDCTTLFAGNIYATSPEIANGLIACIPDHPFINFISEILSKPLESQNTDTILNTTGPAFFTRNILSNPEKILSTDVFFPTDCLYPLPNYKRTEAHWQKLKQKYVKESSLAIHYWDVSWEKRGIIYYSKKIIKALLLWNLWHK